MFRDKTKGYTTIRNRLSKMGINDPSLVDCVNVQYICECVSTRSAHLVSVGLAVLLNKIDDPFVNIGVDGSVYRFHPFFRDLIIKKTRELIKPNIQVSDLGHNRIALLLPRIVV